METQRVERVQIHYKTRRGGWIGKRMYASDMEAELRRLFKRRTEADAYYVDAEGRLSDDRCGGVEYDGDNKLTWWCEAEEPEEPALAIQRDWRCANCDRRYTEKEVYRAYLFGGCPDCGDNGSWERTN